MKYLVNSYFIFILVIVFVACNKDDEIIIDSPVEDPSTSLGYSVIEYTPAPGQFINESVSGFQDITTMEAACRQAEKRLSTNDYVSLGAWGGYIVVKLNKSIENNDGYNFAIAGNSFDSSNEPGIVWVMQDSNHNGKPDDKWYELKGSYYGQPGYSNDYWVTYYRPEAKGNTLWKDSEGEEGYVNWIGTQHTQDFYYPNWVTADSYTLHGSRLPIRAEQNPLTGIWSNLPFEWGYVDNNGSDIIKLEVNGKTIEANSFKISDAINEKGETVNLSSIDFIKVQTAINGSISILGENSTEIRGIFAL